MLYVLSRTLMSLLPRLYTTHPPAPSNPIAPLSHPLPPLTCPASNPRPIPPAQIPFGIVAALSWAGVMYMFRHRGERIQPGMGNSMRQPQSAYLGLQLITGYLYHDSEVWTGLKTLLWHNK